MTTPENVKTDNTAGIDKASTNNTAQKDIVLNHIDKLYATLTKIWDSANHIILSETILTLILIIISTGFVTVDEVSVIGIKFKVSLITILLLGITFVTILHIALLYQLNKATIFVFEISRLYKSINYIEEETAKADAFNFHTIYTSMAEPFVHMKEDSNLLIKIYHTTIGVIAILFFVVLPIIAQIAAGLKIIALYGWSIWAVAFLSSVVILTLVCIFVHWASMEDWGKRYAD
jgi:hypothetical protein